MVLRCKPIFSVLVFHQFMVYWIYFQKGFILFSMPNCGYIMLFRSVISVYLLDLLVKFKRLFCCMIWLYTVGLLSTYERALCVKLSPQKVGVGIEQVLRQMYQIELAYVHILVFRLFVGIMLVNPVWCFYTVDVGIGKN